MMNKILVSRDKIISKNDKVKIDGNTIKLLDSGIRTLPLNTGIYNVTDSSLLLEEEYEKRMKYIKGAK